MNLRKYPRSTDCESSVNSFSVNVNASGLCRVRRWTWFEHFIESLHFCQILRQIFVNRLLLKIFHEDNRQKKGSEKELLVQESKLSRTTIESLARRQVAVELLSVSNEIRTCKPSRASERTFANGEKNARARTSETDRWMAEEREHFEERGEKRRGLKWDGVDESFSFQIIKSAGRVASVLRRPFNAVGPCCSTDASHRRDPFEI